MGQPPGLFMMYLRCRSAVADEYRSHAARSARFCAPLPLGLINLITAFWAGNYCRSSPRAPTSTARQECVLVPKRAFRALEKKILVCRYAM